MKLCGSRFIVVKIFFESRMYIICFSCSPYLLEANGDRVYGSKLLVVDMFEPLQLVPKFSDQDCLSPYLGSKFILISNHNLYALWLDECLPLDRVVSNYGPQVFQFIYLFFRNILPLYYVVSINITKIINIWGDL